MSRTLHFINNALANTRILQNLNIVIFAGLPLVVFLGRDFQGLLRDTKC